MIRRLYPGLMLVCLDDKGNPMDYDAAVALLYDPTGFETANQVGRITWSAAMSAQNVVETKDEYIKAYGFTAPFMPRDPL